MESLKIEVNTLTELDDAAKSVLAWAPSASIFALHGEMGAGKTTFMKSLARQLGIEETVSSPTFSIVNEYDAAGKPVYHFDFYRIKNLQEAYDIGYEDYFYSGNRCFIEWPEKIESLLPENYLKIEIQTIAESQRRITVSKI